MEKLELILERPLWLLLLIPVVLLLLVILLTMKKEKRRQRKTIVSFALHGVIALILALLAAGLSLRLETDRQSTVILLDVSDSTAPASEEMAAVCDTLLQEFASRDVKGVVLFGREAVYVGAKSQWGSVALTRADTSASDITSALYEAVELMDRYTHKRIILLSDGKETSGDALYAARRLAEEGVRIDTMYFDTARQVEREVQISSMSSAGGSLVGEELRISLTLESGFAGEATVTLWDGDALVEERLVTLSVGETVVDWELTASSVGLHAYRALLTCEVDTELRNNEAFTALRTYGKSSLLIVAREPAKAEALKGVLQADAEVTVVAQEDAPRALSELSRYDGYYLMNVDANALPEGFEASLETAVSFLGKSLCFVGGDQTFHKGSMKDTAYERMLPLDYGSDSRKRAVFLVVDVSGSMEEGNALELAKIGAIKILQSMQSNDLVCVIAFAGSAEIVVPPTPMTAANKEAAAKAISAITVAGGTVYTPALNQVATQLWMMEEPPDVKHVLFLSDGEPGEETNDIYRKVKDLRDGMDVLLSTIEIRIEQDKVRPREREDSSAGSILKRMAEIGDGSFTVVTNALELPNIMLEQSESFSPQYAFETPFVPVIAEKDEVTEGLTELPEIRGYVGMHPKEDATVHLISATGDPIYASRAFGAGTVTCFTTDLADEWCQALLTQEAGRRLIRNAMKAARPAVRNDAAFIPSVKVDGGQITVTAELPEEGNDFELTAEIMGPEEQRLYLDRISATTYEGNLSLGQAGEYEVKITWRKRARVVDEATSEFAVSASGEYDLFREGDSRLLAGIAEATGGYLDADPAYLAILDPGLLSSVVSLALPLCLLAALLMLADIVIRRLTVADVKRFFKPKGKDRTAPPKHADGGSP